MDPYSSAPKKNASHGIEVLPQDTTYLLQRPCYQRGSPCQDPADNRITRRLPDHCKETQTAVVWSCLPFIRSGQNRLVRHSERGKKTRPTEEEAGRQHQEMDKPGVRQVPEGSGDQGKRRKLVAKSSVVPQRPLWLRERWGDEMNRLTVAVGYSAVSRFLSRRFVRLFSRRNTNNSGRPISKILSRMDCHFLKYDL